MRGLNDDEIINFVDWTQVSISKNVFMVINFKVEIKQHQLKKVFKL